MPMKGVVVGIDAGGTKTRAFAVGRDGEVVGRGAGGGGNLLSSPDPQGSIGAALSEALGGRDADAIVLSCAGGDRKSMLSGENDERMNRHARRNGRSGHLP